MRPPPVAASFIAVGAYHFLLSVEVETKNGHHRVGSFGSAENLFPRSALGEIPKDAQTKALSFPEP